MQKPTIICVDDEEMILKGLRTLLMHRFGKEYLIEIASSGEEALEIVQDLKAKNIEIPVIISDHIMPGLKGDKLLIHLHEISPKTLKILLTGQADADAVGNAINFAKLYRYIAKPWDPDDLVLTVRKAVQAFCQDKQLRKKEKQYQTLVNNLNVGIYRCTGGEKERFLKVNPAFVRMVGYDSMEELNNIQPSSLLRNPEQRDEIVEMIFQQGNCKNVETVLVRKDGGSIWAAITAAAQYDEHKNIKWIDGLIEDITERKQKEIAEREREIAEAATRAKSRFLARMSHEIRTPVNAILGMAEILSEMDFTLEQKDYVQTVQTSGELLLSIINDILDFSKIEARQVKLESIPFDLNELVDGIRGIFSFQVREKGLTFHCRVAPDVHAFLLGDPTRLSQVLINLIGNAIKFTQKGHVKVDVVNSSDSPPPGMPLFCVCDTGIGIPGEKQETIFDSFSQADASTTRQFGGTGLGLAISKKLVELMGGRMWIESETGKGTRFFFTVALEHTKRELAAAFSPPGGLPGLRSKTGGPEGKIVLPPMRILLAEDILSNQKVMKSFLKKTPAALEFADDGKSAFEKFTANSYDLVLMDIQMPLMDGHQATRAMREWERKNNRPQTPIIALTADIFEDNRKKCFEAGCTDFLPKPIKKQALLRALANASSTRDNGHESAAAGGGPGSSREPLQKAVVPRHGVKDARYKARVASFLESIMPEFFEEIVEKLPAMERAARNGDFKTVVRLGHGFKGASGNYQLFELANTFHAIENASREGDACSLDEGIRKVRLFLESVQIEYG